MIYTIGHSTLTKEEFSNLTTDIDNPIIVDIRSHPTSKWPQFYKEAMEQWLPTYGIKYEWMSGLGGWRDDHKHLQEELATVDVDLKYYTKGVFPKQRIAKRRKQSTTGPEWYIFGLWDYQWFMRLDEFILSADVLIKRSYDENLIIMCCELLPWKCHRSMVSDYLAYKGVEAIHLQPKMKHHFEMLGNRLDRYHPDVKAAWGY